MERFVLNFNEIDKTCLSLYPLPPVADDQMRHPFPKQLSTWLFL